MVHDKYGGDFPEGKKKPKSSFDLRPFLIHLAFVGILLAIIFVFFFFDSSSLFGEEKEDSLIMVGDLKYFSKEISGDLVVEPKMFSLKIPSGSFEGQNSEVVLKGFDGKVTYLNKSLVFDGTVSTIEFGKNTIDNGGGKILFEARNRVTFPLQVTDLSLDFEEGTLKIKDGLVYSLEETVIELTSINMTVVFDGMFSFSGEAKNMKLLDSQRGVSITYVENQS